MALKLHPDGDFGLWSNTPPERAFIDLLNHMFDTFDAHIISFPNPYSGAESTNTIYLARKQT